MPKPSATTPFHLIYGGDPYLNEQTVRDLRHQAQRKHPDAETIELDATNADHYAFDEAVSPSLLSERSIVIVSNLQNADDKLGETMVAYCKQAVNNPAEASIVICQHEGGIKGKRLIDQLTKAGAVKETVADLKKAEAKLNFTIQCFERRNRRIEPMAAQQLVAVLGDKTGELAAMARQLCFDFDDNPITLERVNQYLTARHETTHHGQRLSRTLRHHQRSGSENQFMGAEKRHQTALRMDLRRHETMHPNARMGRRTKQN